MLYYPKHGKHSMVDNVINKIVYIDRNISKAIQMSKLSTKVEHLLAIPTMLFGRHCIPYIIIIAFLILNVHYACYFGLSCLLTVIITEGLKNIVKRPRPRKQSIANRSLPIRDDVSNPAFPSGDSAQAAVVATCIYRITGFKLALLLPIPTMYGRVYFGAHWIGDTIAGVAIGFVTTMYICQGVFALIQTYLGSWLPSALFL